VVEPTGPVVVDILAHVVVLASEARLPAMVDAR